MTRQEMPWNPSQRKVPSGHFNLAVARLKKSRSLKLDSLSMDYVQLSCTDNRDEDA